MKLNDPSLVTGALAFALAASAGRSQDLPLRLPGRPQRRSIPTRSTRRFTLGTLGNVMEGLTKRDKDLKIIPGLAERWEIVDPLQVALLPAQGRQVPRRRGLHRRRRACSRPSACAAPARRSRRACPADTKVVKVDDHTVDFVLTSPNPDPALRSGTPGTSSPRSGPRRTAPTQAQPASATSLSSVRAQGQRHRSVHDRQPRARREDGLQAQPELVGQARAQPRRGDLPDHQVGRHARRRAAVGRDRHDRPGAGAGHRARQGQRQRRRADRARSCARSSSTWTSCATSCSTPTSRARTPSRTRACARPSTRRSTSRRSRPRSCAACRSPSALMISPLLFSRAGEFKRQPYDPRRPPRSCWRRPAIPTASRSTWTARTTATSTTRRSARRSRRCSARIGIKVNAQRPCRRPSTSRRCGPTEQVRHLLQPAGLDAGLVRQLERARQHHRLPRCRRQGRHLQLRRLLQSEDRRADRADPGRDRHRRSATS